MGLDITAYSGLAFALPGRGVDPHGNIDYDNRYFLLPRMPDHPGQWADLPSHPHDPKARIVCSGFSNRFSFRAGSYSGYGQWRERLAQFAGYPKAAFEGEEPSHLVGAWMSPYGPFHELLNFSDCEGAIGPAASARLAFDFASHQARADASPDERFRHLYAEWRQAFELAALGGAVHFH